MVALMVKPEDRVTAEDMLERAKIPAASSQLQMNWMKFLSGLTLDTPETVSASL